MSVKAVQWAKTWVDTLSPTERLLLILLADYYNDAKHYAWPAVPTLAQTMGVTDRTVFRCLARLKDMGLVETEKRYRVSGLRDSSAYYLPFFDPLSELQESPWKLELLARGRVLGVGHPPDIGGMKPLT
jgi:hypothetical protein